MASTTFTDGVSVIYSAWLNDVNSATYVNFGDGSSYTGNLTVGSNKLTVAAASGNTVIAGTLAVTGVTTTSEKIIVTSHSVQFTSGSHGLAASDGNPYLTVGVGIITIASAEARIQSGFNLKIGGVQERATTAATNAVYLQNGTAPVGTLTTGVTLYSNGGKLFAMDSAGSATQLTP